jgi:hypothetical protein
MSTSVKLPITKCIMNPLSFKVYMEHILLMMDSWMGVSPPLMVTSPNVVKKMTSLKMQGWTISWIGPMKCYSYQKVERDCISRRGVMEKVRVVRRVRQLNVAGKEEGGALYKERRRLQSTKALHRLRAEPETVAVGRLGKGLGQVSGVRDREGKESGWVREWKGGRATGENRKGRGGVG